MTLPEATVDTSIVSLAVESCKLETALVRYGRQRSPICCEMLTLHEPPPSRAVASCTVVMYAPGQPVPGAVQITPGAGETPTFALKGALSVARASDLS